MYGITGYNAIIFFTIKTLKYYTTTPSFRRIFPYPKCALATERIGNHNLSEGNVSISVKGNVSTLTQSELHGRARMISVYVIWCKHEALQTQLKIKCLK